MHFKCERAWIGISRSTPPNDLQLTSVEAGGRLVHRFKVDEVEKTVVCTGMAGGLYVASINSMECLWFLPRVSASSELESFSNCVKSYVHSYSHLEADAGFICFTRRDHSVEVWRRSLDAVKEETYLACSPHPSQVMASPLPVPVFPPTFPPVYGALEERWDTEDLYRRGAYLPFALLEHDVAPRASRLVYPTLATASEDAKKAYLWNVATATLVETIDIQGPSEAPNTRLAYIDVSKTHLFVCWGRRIEVYLRNCQGDANNLVYHVAYDAPLDLVRDGFGQRLGILASLDLADNDPNSVTELSSYLPSRIQMQTRKVKAAASEDEDVISTVLTHNAADYWTEFSH